MSNDQALVRFVIFSILFIWLYVRNLTKYGEDRDMVLSLGLCGGAGFSVGSSIICLFN